MGIQLCILQWVDSTSKMKLLVLSSIVVVGLCAPDAEADADAFYGQYQWPARFGVGPYGGFSSTCYGCRPYGHFLGKRSADPDAQLGIGLGVAAHPFGRSFVGRSVQGFSPFRYGFGRPFYGKRSTDAEANPESSSYGKRSAEPHGVVGHVHGLGVAGHPGHATSYVGRTIYGYPSAYGYGRRYYGKRSTDAEANLESFSYGKRSAEPHGVLGHVHGLGVAGHPGHATSYVGRTIYGYPSVYGYGRHYYGKRSAEPVADPHYG